MLLLLASIALLVVATSALKLHPFISLIFASLLLGLGSAAFGIIDIMTVESSIREGFGTILSHIGIVIVLGSIIGVFLEKSGGAVKIADTVIRVLGPKHPEMAMSIIGWLVSIPVFCDSGFIILNAMRKSLTRKTHARAAGMSIALASGLYASHTLVPPTPGPVAAAGNLGLQNSLGSVILFGIFLSLIPMLGGFFWARFIGGKVETREDLINAEFFRSGLNKDRDVFSLYGTLPSAFLSFCPIVIPILLIAVGTIVTIPSVQKSLGVVSGFFLFLGDPFTALLIGFLFALALAPDLNEEVLMKWIGAGIKIAGPIILITGAGGAFGAIIKSTPIAYYLGNSISRWHLGIFLPFLLAAALKTAQGSTTTTMVTVSALTAPLLDSLGLGTPMGALLAVMSIGAGAMTVSHANDSYFWVVAEFTGMDIKSAYKSHTAATAIQGALSFLVVLLLSVVL